MKRLAIELVAILGTVTSVVSLFLQTPKTFWSWVLLVVGIGASLLAAYLSVGSWRDEQPKILRSEEDIRAYLYAWISGSGRTAICTRDMSWAAAEGIRELLRQKAAKGELQLVMPKEIPLSRSLEQDGAETFYYPELAYVVQSRFTVRNLDRIDSAVAIGRQVGKNHHVVELGTSDPAFFVAQDLVEIVRRLGQIRGS